MKDRIKLRNTDSESNQPIGELVFTIYKSQRTIHLYQPIREVVLTDFQKLKFCRICSENMLSFFLLNLILNTPNTVRSIRAKGSKGGRIGKEYGSMGGEGKGTSFKITWPNLSGRLDNSDNSFHSWAASLGWRVLLYEQSVVWNMSPGWSQSRLGRKGRLWRICDHIISNLLDTNENALKIQKSYIPSKPAGSL